MTDTRQDDAAPTEPIAPAEPIADVQQAIVDNFQYLGDWTERYQYLIELGRKLPPFPEDQQIEANRLHGCQARVWLLAENRQGRLFFQATSDAAIVSGLIALLLKVYSGRTPDEIQAAPPAFIDEIGLSEHLSGNRRNGLFHMIARIRAIAAAYNAGCP